MPPDPLAGSGFALVWPFHGHIALQTTLNTPLATPLEDVTQMRQNVTYTQDYVWVC